MSASPEPITGADSAPEPVADARDASPSPDAEASPSPSPETEPVASSSKKRKAPLGATQLIDHLPRAEGDALRTFMELKACTYQNMQLGRSRNVEEGFACECSYDPETDLPDAACGSDCINRLTQIECLEDECRCGAHCQNQRFAKREYAQLHIVQTEKKGFGLRAATDLRRDDFIYEYVGEVVNNTQFMKRMREYADEGIRHFYFMMLQKDEFIDATKKGGIGRFANHSCNPNCYVAKWTVGKRIRMGIFAQRDVKAGEELTFNYNVDRYGHEAQTCYCGEPNCVGFIGGKTQTDVAVLDDLLLDALGITDEVEALGLKGNKKRKGKKLDEDYMPAIRPLKDNEMYKVMQAIKQTSSKKILQRLLGRIKVTEDIKALRQLLRLRVLSALGTILEDYPEDDEMKILVLNCLETVTTGLLSKNKVEESKLEEPVKRMAESENGSVRVVAEKVLEMWTALGKAYRIPKRVVSFSSMYEELTFTSSGTLSNGLVSGPAPGTSSPRDDREPVYKRMRVSPPPPFTIFPSQVRPHQLKTLHHSKPKPPPKPEPPKLALHPVVQRIVDGKATSREVPLAALAPRDMEAKMIQEIIKQSVAARAAAVAANREPTPPPAPEPVRRTDAEIEERARERLRRRKERKERKAREKARRAKEGGSSGDRDKDKDRAARKELQQKHLRKLVGAVVVKQMGKWQKYLSREQFKEHAQKITEKIAESEERHAHGDNKKLDKLSEKQTTKIQGFVKSYMEKTVYRIRKEAKAKASAAAGESSATPPVSDRTEKTEEGPDTPPDAHGDSDIRMGEAWEGDDSTMALYDDLPKELGEEAMDTESDSDSDSEDDGDARPSATPVALNPSTSTTPGEPPASVTPDEPRPQDVPAAAAPVAIAV